MRTSSPAESRPAAGLDPEQALGRGCWRKLICGASNQDLPAVEELAWAYSLAGVHCIDVAADPAVATAARRGMAAAAAAGARRPWLMVSLSDGEDAHFRKARFDPQRCPRDCPRPCQHSCPAQAIDSAGVRTDRCYGCGRCLTACPLGLISAHPWRLGLDQVGMVLTAIGPDAVEIHTAPGRTQGFQRLLPALRPLGGSLRRLAVSAGGGCDARTLARYLWCLHPQLLREGQRPLWQLDGRPMSGDVGDGMAHAAVNLAAALVRLAPPGPLQLAGGTNASTQRLLERAGLARPPGAAGVAGLAFGGAARRLLAPWIATAQARGLALRDCPDLGRAAVRAAAGLLWGERGGNESLPAGSC